MGGESGVDVYTGLCTEQRTGETCGMMQGTLLDALWRPRRERTFVHTQLMHFTEQQKGAQRCEATMPQLKSTSTIRGEVGLRGPEKSQCAMAACPLRCVFNLIQTHLGDPVGLVPDHGRKASHTRFFAFGFSVHKSYAYTIVSPTKRAIVCLRKQYAYLNLKILYC